MIQLDADASHVVIRNGFVEKRTIPGLYHVSPAMRNPKKKSPSYVLKTLLAGGIAGCAGKRVPPISPDLTSPISQDVGSTVRSSKDPFPDQ